MVNKCFLFHYCLVSIVAILHIIDDTQDISELSSRLLFLLYNILKSLFSKVTLAFPDRGYYCNKSRENEHLIFYHHININEE